MIAGVEVVAWLVDVVVKSSAIVLVALLFAACLRKALANVRYAVWAGACASLVVLPMLASAIPVWQVPILPAWHVTAVIQGPVGSPALDAARNPAIGPQRPAYTGDAGTSQVVLPAVVKSSLPDSAMATLQPAGTRGGGVVDASRSDTRGWLIITLAVWGLGAALALGRLAVGLHRLKILKEESCPFESTDVQRLLARASAAVGLRRPVTLLISPTCGTPMSWGYRNPVVMLPAEAAQWSADRLRIVLLHELTHVRRLDWLMHMSAHLATAVQWFNPLAWLALARLADEREKACDEDVVAGGTRPSEYAHHLLELSLSLKAVRPLRGPALAMAQGSHLEERLMSILTCPTRTPRGRGARVLIVCAMLAVAGSLGLINPWSTVRADSPRDGRSENDWQPLDASVSFSNMWSSGGDSSSGGSAVGRTDGDFVFKWWEGDFLMELRAHGAVEFEEGTCIIERIDGDDAYVLMRTESGAQFKQMKVTSDGRDLEYTWFIDGERQPVDRAARTWHKVFTEVCSAYREIAEIRGGSRQLAR